MNITMVLKIVGVGIIVGVACQLLQKSGRDEQATLVTVAGIVIVMLLLSKEIGALFSSIRAVFGL